MVVRLIDFLLVFASQRKGHEARYGDIAVPAEREQLRWSLSVL